MLNSKEFSISTSHYVVLFFVVNCKPLDNHLIFAVHLRGGSCVCVFEFLLLLINILLGKVYNTVVALKCFFFFFNIFLNTFALMLFDSLCAYLVFSCFILLFWFSCHLLHCFSVCVCVCFSFIFVHASAPESTKSFRALCPLYFIAVLNICLCFSVHLTFRPCCVFRSVYQFNYEFPLPVLSTICVFPTLNLGAVSFLSLSLFALNPISTEPN